MTYMLSATTSAAWAVVTTMLTAKCQTASGTALTTAMCGLLTKARLSPPQPMFSSIGVSMKLSKIQVGTHTGEQHGFRYQTSETP